MKRNKPFKTVTHLTHLRLYSRMQLSAVRTGEQVSCGYKAAQATGSDGQTSATRVHIHSHSTGGSQHLLGAGLSLSINHVLLAARHGLGIDHIGLVARGAGERPRRHFFTCPGSSLLGAAAAVDALAVQGCLVLCPAPDLSFPQRAPGRFAVEVGLAAAALDVLHEAVVAAGPGRAAHGFAVVLAAPALHLAVRAVAPVLHVPLQGPVVQLVNEKTGDKKMIIII